MSTQSFSWLLIFGFSLLSIGCGRPGANWALGPVERPLDAQPIITPTAGSSWYDPMTQQEVKWESMATFNPAAVVKDDTVFVLYRAEEKLGEKEIGGHTSRLGMAFSTDGRTYERLPAPVFYPDNDDQKEFEWTGGVEDPRIVETADGTYVMTYTQWNRVYPRLAVATSKDLRHWQKHGPIFIDYKDGKYHDRESKSGAIVTALKDGKLVATKINGKYWMYFGVPHIWLAHSDDLLQWTPVETIDDQLAAVLSPRPGYFDSWLVEAGPPPVLTEQGIVVLYNAGNQQHIGVSNLPNRVYTAGQALYSPDAPWKLLDRSDEPFLKPELPFEKTGQYADGTTFIEGLVLFQGYYYLYYGTADSKVGAVRWRGR